jgi:hypothetical protein
MPILNGVVSCVNHKTPMRRNDGFSAITGVTKKGESVSFNPSNGVPGQDVLLQKVRLYRNVCRRNHRPGMESLITIYSISLMP